MCGLRCEWQTDAPRLIPATGFTHQHAPGKDKRVCLGGSGNLGSQGLRSVSGAVLPARRSGAGPFLIPRVCPKVAELRNSHQDGCFCKNCYAQARLSWHAFRRTHATLLQYVGGSLKDAQAQLGHSKLSTTLAFYTFAIPAHQRASAEKLGELLTNVDVSEQPEQKLAMPTRQIQ